MGKGCVVSCWTVFNQVTPEQVKFLSTEGTGPAKPSRSAVLKYYYLSLSSLPPSFLWVGAAQGNHGSGQVRKKMKFGLCLQPREGGKETR